MVLPLRNECFYQPTKDTMKKLTSFILAGLVIMCNPIKAVSAPPVPSSPLVECRWTLSGGKRGGHDIIKIVRSGDVAVITTSYAELHNSEPIEATYEAPLDTLDEIKAIFAREGMNAWPKLPMGGERFRDMDLWSMHFSFDGPGRYAERNFRFSEEQAIPDKGRAAVSEILGILRKISQGGDRK